MGSVENFHLPDLGEGLTEGELLSWHIGVGDRVELNQTIAEVETAKASVELPSPFQGTIEQMFVEAGETVAVGTPIVSIDRSDTQPKQDFSEQDTETKDRSVLVGYGPRSTESNRRRKRAAAESSETNTQINRPLAKPPVRKLARDLGVDLTNVEAKDDQGVVTRDEVLAYATDVEENGATAPTRSAQTNSADRQSQGEDRHPVRGLRQHTAQAMVHSAFTAPHVTEFITVDVTPTMELLTTLQNGHALANIRLTPLTLVAKAVLVALRRNPVLNSSFDDQTNEIVTKHYVNLGIAAATPRGLVVPNIKEADRLALNELATAINELTLTAKDGRTSREEMTEGTITITNIGIFGVDFGTPIINPGEAAILCLGAIKKQPWEHNNEIALRSITTLGLSFDHRIVDGKEGSCFLADIASVLSDPLNLIALG